MIAFALFDRVLYLNISLIEYVLVILYRIVMLYLSGGNPDGLNKALDDFFVKQIVAKV